MPPLVSVLLPTFNQAAFVAEAIASAAEQEYPDLEIVVGDDGSTDGTPDIIEAFRHRFPGRVVPVADRSHLGIAGNCNRILAACRGEYVAFHAGDDVWLPGKVTAQVDWLTADRRRVLCGHDVEVFDAASGAALYQWSRIQKMFAGSDPAMFVRYGNPYHPLGNMVRADVIPAGGYDARVLLASDWKFFVDCVSGGGAFGFVPGVLARYRLWTGNVSRRTDEMLRDLLLTLDLIDEAYPALRAAARSRRAALLSGAGVRALHEGRIGAARTLLGHSLHHEWSTRTGALLALARLPAPLVPRLVQAARYIRRGAAPA